MAGTLDDLGDQLRASAGDRPGELAAIAVLATHRRWLRHPSFLLTCVRTFRGQSWIHWPIVRRFVARTPCPDLDAEVLLLAAELATGGDAGRLDDSTVLRQLDDLAYQRLARAVAQHVIVSRSGGPAPQ